jgi:hypothetical protein
MTNLNKPAMGLVLIGALVLGGCSGGGTQYTSSDTKRTEVAQQPGTTATTPGTDTNNNGIDDRNETANNTTTDNNTTANNNPNADNNTANNTTSTTTTDNNTTANNNNTTQGKKANGDLSIVSFDKNAKLGQEVTLTAKAEPGVKVKIEADGAGMDMGLGDQTANDKGEVTWKWKVDNGFKANEMPVIVTALYDDIEKKQIAEIKVDQPKDKVASFSSNVTGLKKSVQPGEQLTLKVKTSPKADVKIKADGIDGFDPGGKKADANGVAEFTFKLDKNYKADKMPIIVTTDLDGKQKKTVEALEVPKVAMKKDNGKNL